MKTEKDLSTWCQIHRRRNQLGWLSAEITILEGQIFRLIQRKHKLQEQFESEKYSIDQSERQLWYDAEWVNYGDAPEPEDTRLADLAKEFDMSEEDVATLIRQELSKV